MRKRDLRLEKYGITQNRYAELRAFAKQYPEWKKELESKKDTVGSPNIDGMPKGTGINNSTSNLAIRRAILSIKCNLIEEALTESGGDLVEYLKASVCYEKPLGYLYAVMEMPCEQKTFYDIRRYFFYILDQKIDKNF